MSRLLRFGIKWAIRYALFQQIVVHVYLYMQNTRRNIYQPRNSARIGRVFEQITEREKYTIRHIIEDGIERIAYIPVEKRHQTPIVMQHGMWHGAWAWEAWQGLLAEWGWESHAHSLPGHARSPVQRPIWQCTLDYYLGFLKQEIDRQPRKPVLMGHSMGGALTQWYLKHVSDDLPAAVLVASWPRAATMTIDNGLRLFALDLPGMLQMFYRWDATSWVRTPEAAAQKLITPGAVVTARELYSKLTPESAIVLFQHNPPHWSPPDDVKTPMLWLAGEKDAFFDEQTMRESAAGYGADYIVVPGEGHNLMMERSYAKTAHKIHAWLEDQGIE